MNLKVGNLNFNNINMRKKSEMTSKEKEVYLRANPVNQFKCGACNECAEMSKEVFNIHLTEIHKLDASKLKGTRQMVMHMDGDYWYSYTYQWTLEGGLVFTQFIEQARAEDDPMRFF